MLVVMGDTHGRQDHRLAGSVQAAIHEADAVVHTGDFITQAVLDAFEAECPTLYAVHGNNDSKEVCDRLPPKQVFETEGLRIVVVHGHEHTHTALSILGRQEDADLLIVGHSHSPQFIQREEVAILNPGSHAVPRQFRPAYATLQADAMGVEGRLIDPDGTVFEEFTIRRRAE